MSGHASTPLEGARATGGEARPSSPWRQAPLQRAPERSRTVFSVLFTAALGPLLAGAVFFGYKSLMLAGACVASCYAIEWVCYRLARPPALMHASHACLTGLLLALTLPPMAPWYVALAGSAFAILLGKALFGGVGHFLWQPALVGRLAVAVMFGATLSPATWPLLAPAHVLAGDVETCAEPAEPYLRWADSKPAPQAEGYLLPRPTETLRKLTDADNPRYKKISYALTDLPPMQDMLGGAVPGGIGETSAIVILVAGLYLIYRNYIRWALPVYFILSAALTAAIAPITLAEDLGPRTVWAPAFSNEGMEAGLAYVSFHLAAGELMLAAFFLAPEMTSRPVTPRGQALFGLGCGVLTILLRLYVLFPLSAYVAVLAMNTLTPIIERFTRPRVLGKRSRVVRVLGLKPTWHRRLNPPE